MELPVSELRAALQESAARRLLVAYSGGLDSTCLLQAAIQVAQADALPLRVCHINHGIQAQSDAWQTHCERVCAAAGVPLICKRVELAADASEEVARRARYEVFAELLEADECLLMGHHLDDQLETLLLRLLRGAGSAGLRGMPRQRALGAGQLLRPWLSLKRSALLQYAEQEALDWVEDVSNAGTAYDRNFCRNEIFPRIEQRWPAYRESWSKSQQLLAESAELVTELASADLQLLLDSSGGIDCVQLLQLSPARQRNVLRHWLSELGLSAPGWQLLRQIQEEFIVAPGDNSGVLDLGNFYLQRFQQQLFALRSSPLEEGQAAIEWNAQQQGQLLLPGNGQLSMHARTGSGLRSACSAQLQVRYREGGESLRLPDRPDKSLKKLFQEQRIPPWLRERTPLIYVDGRLACVPGLGVATEFTAVADEAGCEIAWRKPDLLQTREPKAE